MGAGWKPAWCVSHAAPRRLTVHRRVFGPAVEFGHEFNGIVCNAADLDTPNPGADPVMARYSQKLLAPSLAHSARSLTACASWWCCCCRAGCAASKWWLSTWAWTAAPCTASCPPKAATSARSLETEHGELARR